jgi:2-keto-4-pentenoate hydratase/2-oxohepta-3-ene-1,7-dioic acid hydratase in catechol pathway
VLTSSTREVVVVIGKPMFRVPASQAMDHVFGYTQANDVTWTQWVHWHHEGGTPDLPVEERGHVLSDRARRRDRR